MCHHNELPKSGPRNDGGHRKSAIAARETGYWMAKFVEPFVIMKTKSECVMRVLAAGVPENGA